MSSTAAASAYWRVAGMSYLKYSNLCATMVRDALKEPLKESAKTRELVYFKNVTYKDGQADKQGVQLRLLALAALAIARSILCLDIALGVDAMRPISNKCSPATLCRTLQSTCTPTPICCAWCSDT